MDPIENGDVIPASYVSLPEGKEPSACNILISTLGFQ